MKISIFYSPPSKAFAGRLTVGLPSKKWCNPYLYEHQSVVALSADCSSEIESMASSHDRHISQSSAFRSREHCANVGAGGTSPPTPRTAWKLEGGRRERKRKKREMKRKGGLEEEEGRLVRSIHLLLPCGKESR